MDINLLRNYNVSLTDVYKNLSEIEAFTPQYAPSQAASTLKKVFLTLITIGVSFGLIGAILILLFDPFRPTMRYVQLDPEPVVVPDIVPPPPGYVQIQVLDFGFDMPMEGLGDDASQAAVESLPPIADNETAQVASAQVAQARPTPNRANNRPANRRPTQDAPAAVPPEVAPENPTYAVVLASATPAEYDILSSLASTSGLTVEIASSNNTRETRWMVYVPEAGTGITINVPNTLGIMETLEVTPLRGFASRAEALAYAQSHGGKTVIKAEEAVHPVYELRVCCMLIDDAKLFAQRTGITDKLFQLRRE
jgi:hypothetical protein